MITVIAEIGINHNGDISIAKKLIDIAKLNGCHFVKFQKRSINTVYTEEFLNSKRESPWGTIQRDQKQGIEFDKNDYEEINKYCQNIGIKWFASAWDTDSQFFLRNFNLPVNKVASAMLDHNDLLNVIADEGKYTYISTGMSDFEKINNAIKIFKRYKCPYELMHCVSTYPLNLKDANLKRINLLKNTFKCEVGYSGHEVGISVSYAAITLGINSIERHITLNRSMYGSDQASSLEPNGLRLLTTACKEIPIALGEGLIDMRESEKSIESKLKYYK